MTRTERTKAIANAQRNINMQLDFIAQHKQRREMAVFYALDGMVSALDTSIERLELKLQDLIETEAGLRIGN